MPVNLDKPQRWKADILQSVDLYNDWFMRFAPKTYRETRVVTTAAVEKALQHTANLAHITPDILIQEPSVLAMLRMATAPPIARDRLIGLAGVSRNLVSTMEDVQRPRVPPSMSAAQAREQLTRIGEVIERLADRDIFPWLEEQREPTEPERYRAATIVADRLCGAQADPIVRNAQETQMLEKIGQWLSDRGYERAPVGTRFDALAAGTFAFRLNAEGRLEDGAIRHIPIDVVITARDAAQSALPLLIEAKSAGDFTNVNKRRKEEANKVANLRRRYGSEVRFVLYLRGYFDTGYLGYEAAEGIDWFWEHRMDDLAAFGV